MLTPDKVSLSPQRKYFLDPLKETGKLGCKPIGAPIEQNHKIGSSEESPRIEKTRCQTPVGKLIYLTHTRPDLTYEFNVVCQLILDPLERHVQEVNKILQYFKIHLRILHVFLVEIW